MSGAPICFINPQPPTAEPTAVTIPAIPVATDLASAIQAINALTQLVRTLANQGNQIVQQFQITSLTSKQDPKKNNFVEVKAKRITKKTKVTDPNDPSTFVTVDQITGLTFNNAATKQEITWTQ